MRLGLPAREAYRMCGRRYRRGAGQGLPLMVMVTVVTLLLLQQLRRSKNAPTLTNQSLV